MDGLRFSVATNFEPDFIEAIAGYPVAEVFGKLRSDAIGGGRASSMLSPLSEKRFREHVAEARTHGIGFNYLLNPACMDNRESTRQGQRDIERTLNFIEDCGIEAVTISLPSLLPVIKKRHPKLKVRVGVYARVDGASKAKFWEDLGADEITLESISVNRNLGLLAAIRRAVGIELQLLANSNCLMFCPLSGQHMVNLSHASQKGHESLGFMIDWCALRCSFEKLNDPAAYLRSEFIRPEDLRTYRELGYSSFKILERGAPTAVMARRVKAYSEGRFEGNLLDLIQPYGYKEKKKTGGLAFWRYFLRPDKVKLGRLLKLKRLADRRGLTGPPGGDPVYIDNRALDGFAGGFRDRDCRGLSCNDCGYCSVWARKAVRVDEAWRSEVLGLYRECFEDMDSGRLWG